MGLFAGGVAWTGLRRSVAENQFSVIGSAELALPTKRILKHRQDPQPQAT